jgi:hypothetical protein
MSEQYDAPNQQVVRGDGSGPWEEGDGGGVVVDEAADAPSLDDMTKDELIEVASDRGLDVNATMTKAEIRAVIEAG